MHRSAVLSSCGTYRYALRRAWDAARPPVLFVMLNPSTADAEVDDRTIGRCVGFARDWGHGGLVVANLFAFRSTDPRALRSARDPVGPENNRWLAALAGEASRVVAAWGNGGRYRDRDAAVLPLLGSVECLEVTRRGAPWHPLYVRAEVAPSSLAR